MRYKVGAEQLQRVPSLAHRPDGVFRVTRTAPVSPTHAVYAMTGATVCGINAEALEVLNKDWEAACFVEKCAESEARRRPGSTTASLREDAVLARLGLRAWTRACPTRSWATTTSSGADSAEHYQRQLVRQLERLGHKVTLEPIHAA